MSQFNQGDIVQLKITQLQQRNTQLVVESCEEKWVYCLWKDDAENLHREKFLEEMLEAYSRSSATFSSSN